MFCARPKENNVRVIPASPMAITFFLPILSESRPQKGEKINCASAKDAPRNPIVRLLAENIFAYIGSKGKIDAKATILINTAAYMGRKWDNVNFFCRIRSDFIV